MTIDWNALAQIDAPGCVEWILDDESRCAYWHKFMRLLSDEEFFVLAGGYHDSVNRDQQDTVDIIMADHLDAMFDEAAGYA